jgi:hypothetical protein
MLGILDKIKNAFKKDVAMNCGYVDTTTGESFTTFKKANGTLVHKPSGKVNSWGNPVFHGVISFPVTTYHQTWFTAPRKVARRTERRSLFKQTHVFNGRNRYFFDYDGVQQFIDTDAFEKMETIILL